MNNLKQMIKVASEEQEKKGIPWGHIGAGAAGLGLGALAMYGGQKGLKHMRDAENLVEGKFFQNVSGAIDHARNNLKPGQTAKYLHEFHLPKGSKEVTHNIIEPVSDEVTFVAHSSKLPLHEVPKFIKNNLKTKGKHSMTDENLNAAVGNLFSRLSSDGEIFLKLFHPEPVW